MSSFAQRLDQWIDRYCLQFPFSGSLQVTKNDQILLRRDIGLANRELSVPIGPDTRFRLYSMTKPFCALGLLQLHEQGLVSLDDHPGKYLPQAKTLHPGITLRRLMDHSSGLPDFSQSPDFRLLQYQRPVDVAALLRCITEMPMNFAPGTATNYTNVGFFLISMVVEAVSGISWAQYTENEVFAPLGMGHTVIDTASRLVPNRAAGYDVDGLAFVSAPYLCIDWMKGAGAAIGTVSDVYRLHLAAQNRTFLRPETWDMVFTPSAGVYGLGCSVTRWHGKLRYTHNGGHFGFRTLHIHLPEENFDIILLSNTGFGNARTAFSEAIYQLYFGEGDAADAQPAMDPGFARNGALMYPALQPQRPNACPIPLVPYVGTYGCGDKSIQVTIQGNGPQGLDLLLPTGQHLPIYPIAQDVFCHRLIDETYVFSRNKQGALTIMGLTKR